MSGASPAPAIDRLRCPRCDDVVMTIEIHDAGSGKIVCAGCGDVVAYTSGLVRVTLGAKTD